MKNVLLDLVKDLIIFLCIKMKKKGGSRWHIVSVIVLGVAAVILSDVVDLEDLESVVSDIVCRK
jgi:hypothetical protein